MNQFASSLRAARAHRSRTAATLAGGLLLTLLLGAGLVHPAAAATTAAGEVHQFTGRAMAATSRGRIRALQRGASIFPGDVLTTGPNSYLRIKYTDGGFMTLRPNTRFVIEEYQHTGKVEEEKGFFRLLKGGLRAVTGLIGKIRKRNYRLATPIATIGIRGTDFTTRVCAGDCRDVDPAPANGLYVGLEHNEGVIVFNQVGQVELTRPGSFAFTAGPNRRLIRVSPRFASPLTKDPIPTADPELCS